MFFFWGEQGNKVSKGTLALNWVEIIILKTRTAKVCRVTTISPQEWA